MTPLRSSVLKRRPVPDEARLLVAAGADLVLARIFAARGVRGPDELELRLPALPPFQQLKGAEEAARRLAQAVERRERIVVIADYDADGATACALAVRGLSAMGAVVDFIVPNRLEHGYGLTPDIVALAASAQPRLLLTVDNGIASIDGVRAAAAQGIDVLITDHHLPGPQLPAPAIIVNPNQPGCPFPSKHLAGVGVMFYVLIALRALLRERGVLPDEGPNLAGLLDLVALGTVADVVTLDHVNRVFVEQGLRRIRGGAMQPGIRALFAAAGRPSDRAHAFDLGFAVGPRLNAAGRLADMALGIRCLLVDDDAAAKPLARELDALNDARRDVEAGIQEEALEALRESEAALTQPDRYTLCLARPEWHPGVIGIVASRLKDRFHRPTIVFGSAGNDNAPGELRGSGRSVNGFHLRDALDLITKRAPWLIRKFGGHAMAAGLTLHEDALPEFVACFEEIAREWLTPAQLDRVVETDGELESDHHSLDFAQTLRDHVWGQGFPAPSFDGIFTVEQQRIVGEKHLKLTLRRQGKTFDAMLFQHAEPLPPQIRAAYRLDVNHFLGLQSLQLIVEHWWPA